jgi:electron-transferring-flavoprotein dehydrogenase
VNLERAYVARRRRSWVEAEARQAARARDGFQRGFVTGLLGMGLAGLTRGLLHAGGRSLRPRERVPSVEAYYRGRLGPEQIAAARREAAAEGVALQGRLMRLAGWPAVEFDGRLLLSHQDALLVGGKVQAPPGWADHVVFLDPAVCAACDNKVCIEACSGQAILPGDASGVPRFDRDRCVHCGACLWNCTRSRDPGDEWGNVELRAGAGGLRSVEN